MHRLVLLCLLIAASLGIRASERSWYYLVRFKDKGSMKAWVTAPREYLSDKSIERRKQFHIPITLDDVPVAPEYLEALEASKIRIHIVSKWLNAVVCSSDSKQWSDSFKFSFIRSVQPLGERKVRKSPAARDINELLSALESKVDPGKKRASDSSFYGRMYRQVQQLNIHKLHEQGYTGKGVTVAVLDAGFLNFHVSPFLPQLTDSSHLSLKADVIDPGSPVYDDDPHGLAVLSCMASFKPNQAVGTAYGADYMLIRTEDATQENLLEEVAWSRGAEIADSAGADMIQSSLGYNEFDHMEQNHRFKELDGKTALISKAASMAVARGMLVVNSAGNEGDNDWRTIVAPADVKEVITVGGVDSSGNFAAFSSTGPTADKRIKPDVVALGEHTFVVSPEGILYPGNGTSYACPLISGGAACLIQACPGKTPAEIGEALRLSGDNYNDPDKYMGYGIPDLLLAKAILSDTSQGALLQATFLADKRLHLTYSNQGAHKIQLKVFNEAHQLIYSDQWKMKQSGTFRLAIRKSKKWSSGTYRIQWTGASAETEINLQKP